MKNNEIFIRNLAFDVTSDKLSALFESYGPIKRIEVASNADGSSKGYAFLTFSLEDDAKAAIAAQQGQLFVGRKLQLESVIKKPRKLKRGEEVAADEEEVKSVEVKKAKSAVSKARPVKAVAREDNDTDDDDDDEDAENKPSTLAPALQAIVMGVPLDIVTKKFKQAVKKIVRKVEVKVIQKGDPIFDSIPIVEPSGKCFWMGAPSRKHIDKLIAALEGKAPSSLGLRDAEEAAKHKGKKVHLVVRRLADVASDELRKRRNRVIVRNLSFQATEQNIADRLAKFGPLTEVFIPRVSVTRSPERRGSEAGSGEASMAKLKPRGFGFVTFLCLKDKEQALNNFRGLRICNREFVVDNCLSKETFDLQSEAGRKAGEPQGDGQGDEGDEEVGSGDGDDEDGSGDDEEDANDDDEEADNGDDEEDSNDGDEEADNGDDGEEDIDDREKGEAVKDEEKEERPDDVGEGLTVFVRELPFDADRRDLVSAFRRFGSIAMAAIVKDKQTGNSRGSAFVKFGSAEAVQRCVAATDLLVKDRRCKVDIAVDRSQAAKLKEDDRALQDRRNIYLANEGLIVAQGEREEMVKEDVTKIQKSQAEKKKKLQNPLFFVSAHRLSVRNLQKGVDDNKLRALCLRAVRAGLARELVTRKDVEMQLIAQGVRSSERTADRLQVPSVGKGCIKKVKVMVDQTRVGDGGKGHPSRGFGFVEFSEHAHALACVRELSNSKSYSTDASPTTMTGGRRRLVAEFTLENKRKVMILEKRVESKRRREEPEAFSANEAAGDGDEEEEESKSKKAKLVKKDKSEGESSSSSSSSNVKKRKAAEEEVLIAEDDMEGEEATGGDGAPADKYISKADMKKRKKTSDVSKSKKRKIISLKRKMKIEKRKEFRHGAAGPEAGPEKKAQYGSKEQIIRRKLKEKRKKAGGGGKK